MSTRLMTLCSILTFSVVGAACGSADAEDVVAPAALPRPSVVTSPVVEPEESPTTSSAPEVEKTPCENWEAALDTLILGDTLAEQSQAVDRWLASIYTSVDSPAVGMPLVDFRDSVDALAGIDWDFAVADDGTLTAWAEGFMGGALVGAASPPIPRDDCEVSFEGPDAAATAVDCILRLEPGFTRISGLVWDEIDASSEAETDRISSDVIRQWVEAGASPLCVSQVLWAVPTEDLERYVLTLSPQDAGRLATASLAMSNAVDVLGATTETTFVEVDGVIP